MTRARQSPSLTEDQVLHFRTARSHLAGPGAESAVAAASRILGAQAQQEAPALFALSQRTTGRPTAVALKALLSDVGSRTLVRTWGQRDTLHVYDPADWAVVVAARSEWPQSGRRGAMPTEADIEIARRAFERTDRPLFRKDLFALIPSRYLEEVSDHPGAGKEPIRLAATRLIWRLAMTGEVCFADKIGAEQTYAHRNHWFPTLAWPDSSDGRSAAIELARRYLAVYGPATPADIAHFFGSRVSSAKSWLEAMGSKVLAVDCDGRKNLVALAGDLEALRSAPVSSAAEAVRLLSKWDTHLMTHKDKSWILPRAEEAPRVWRKAGDISATLLAGGRIVATWSHRTTTSRLFVEVAPLSGWRASYRAGLDREARALARYLGLPSYEIDLTED